MGKVYQPHMWQSWIEIECFYSVAYFEHITEFDARDSARDSAKLPLGVELIRAT